MVFRIEGRQATYSGVIDEKFSAAAKVMIVFPFNCSPVNISDGVKWAKGILSWDYFQNCAASDYCSYVDLHASLIFWRQLISK